MEFKKIKGVFKATNRADQPVEITVERRLSGANAYGDRSSHQVYINGEWYRGFDTRYDSIPTDKENWLKEVIQYIIKPMFYDGDEYNESRNAEGIELISYNEEMVETA